MGVHRQVALYPRKYTNDARRWQLHRCQRQGGIYRSQVGFVIGFRNTRSADSHSKSLQPSSPRLQAVSVLTPLNSEVSFEVRPKCIDGEPFRSDEPRDTSTVCKGRPSLMYCIRSMAIPANYNTLAVCRCLVSNVKNRLSGLLDYLRGVSVRRAEDPAQPLRAFRHLIAKRCRLSDTRLDRAVHR